MGDVERGRVPRAAGVVLGLLLVLGLAVGGVVGARALLADPGVLDDRARGTVVEEAWFRGTRAAPAELGDTLRWKTADGGTVEVVVEHAEEILDDREHFVPDWPGVADCQGMFLVQLTVTVEGTQDWRPAEQLRIQRMSSSFGAQTAAPGTDVLEQPVLSAQITLDDGESTTGTAIFRAGTGADWSGNLVISTDQGRPLHVLPSVAPPLAAGCTGG